MTVLGIALPRPFIQLEQLAGLRLGNDHHAPACTLYGESKKALAGFLFIENRLKPHSLPDRSRRNCSSSLDSMPASRAPSMRSGLRSAVSANDCWRLQRAILA